MKATMGTVRYASGLIAKNNREEVKVKTPTASISVRGTDFSMTVDELGRSLVILLPSLPQYGPPVVGTITVDNGMGKVTLTKAYQATMVVSTAFPPSAPVLLNFEDETKVNNMLLIDTPKSVTQATKEAKKASVTAAKDDGGDSKDKKTAKAETKTETKTAVAQVDNNSNTPAPVEEEHTATTSQETSLDINKISPETNATIMNAIAPTVQQTNVASSIQIQSPPVSVPTSTTNNGFTTDGTRAILYISKSNNVVWYTLKFDTNATINITDKDGTTQYPLNFGSKVKINIIQK